MATTEQLIPLIFGSPGSRSANNLLFGPQAPSMDLLHLVTGVPTTPASFTSARNLEALTSFQVKNIQAGKLVYDVPGIATRFGVPSSELNQALTAAPIRFKAIQHGATIDALVNDAMTGAELLIGAAFAFLGGVALAPAGVASAGVGTSTGSSLVEASSVPSLAATFGSAPVLIDTVGPVGVSAAFASEAVPVVGEFAQIGASAVPATSELFGVGASLEATRLGLTPIDLLAPPSTLSTLISGVKTFGSAVGEGAAGRTIGQKLLGDITSGNIGGLLSDLGQAIGLPIPNFGTSPSPSPSYAGSGGAGGGGVNPTLTVANPASVNLPMYVIGAGLLIVIGIIMFRGRG